MFEQLSRYYASSAANVENKQLWAQKDKARKKGMTSAEMGIELPGVEGRVWYQDMDLLTLKEADIRTIRGGKITYVPQGTSKSLNPTKSIESQTLESLWAHIRDTDTPENEVIMRVLEVLNLVELGDMEQRRFMLPPDFSSGEDQRVLLAMALITKPDLLIADEPTTALDAAVRFKILEAIELSRKELGLSVLMISNDAGLISETCDFVGVMSAGRIMEFADVATIMNSPRHPFTQAFMLSNPNMQMMRKLREEGKKLRTLPGNPPSALNLPSGCPFHPRCEYADNKCKDEVPEYRKIGEGHWIFCHWAEEIPQF